MVNQPPPYDPNYGQQPQQQPDPNYGQQPAQDYGQQPQAPAYGPPPGGQLPPPAYPMPQPGFNPPRFPGGPSRPGGVSGVMALFLILAGVQVAALILAIVNYIDYEYYSYDRTSFTVSWFFAAGVDVAKIVGLIVAGVMVAGGKDGARIFGAFVAGAVLQGAIGTVVSLAVNLFVHGHANILGVLSFLFNFLLVAGSVVAVVMAVGKPVSRWFAEKVLGRTA